VKLTWPRDVWMQEPVESEHARSDPEQGHLCRTLHHAGERMRVYFDMGFAIYSYPPPPLAQMVQGFLLRATEEDATQPLKFFNRQGIHRSSIILFHLLRVVETLSSSIVTASLGRYSSVVLGLNEPDVDFNLLSAQSPIMRQVSARSSAHRRSETG
jgi:hypothetical protein